MKRIFLIVYAIVITAVTVGFLRINCVTAEL
jgi:hypothetical protein